MKDVLQRQTLWSTLPRIKIWENSEIDGLFPTTTKRTAIGQGSLIGTVQGQETQQRMTGVALCFLKYYTAKSMAKRDWVWCQK